MYPPTQKNREIINEGQIQQMRSQPPRCAPLLEGIIVTFQAPGRVIPVLSGWTHGVLAFQSGYLLGVDVLLTGEVGLTCTTNALLDR